MSEQTLKFEETVVNEKDFHASKEGIVLDLVDAVEYLFLTNLNSMKHFIGYLHADDVIRLMSGYKRHFDNF